MFNLPRIINDRRISSPRIIEYTRHVNRVFTVIIAAIPLAERGLTSLYHASVKVVESVDAHARPMDEKLYADSKAMNSNIAQAGTSAIRLSENTAIPYGNARTPAPRMVMTKLKVDVAIEEPPSLSISKSATTEEASKAVLPLPVDASPVREASTGAASAALSIDLMSRAFSSERADLERAALLLDSDRAGEAFPELKAWRV